MSTAVFLSNQNIRAVVGKKGGKSVTITSVFQAEAPEGSIINGQIINEEEFTNFIEGFWTLNKLPRTDVTLTLGGTSTANRLIRVPKMSYKKLMEYIPREYAAAEQRKDPVYSYVVCGKDGKLLELYTTMAERSFLEPFVRMFKELHIRLTSIVTADIGRVIALDSLSYIQGKTSVVQVLDGMSLSNILYVDGKYYQHNNRRIFGERGTPAFGVECARSISALQQFLKTQQIDSTITNVYLCGEYGQEGLEVCRESMLQMDDTLQVESLHDEPGGAIRYKAGDTETFNCYTSLIGALMIPVGASNLLRQYGRDPVKLERQRAMLKMAAPFAATVFVFGTAAAVETFLWFQSTEVVNTQLDYLADASVIEKAAEYDSLIADNENIANQLKVIQLTKEKLDSYPSYTSEIKAVVQECAVGLGTAEITGFDQKGGVIYVSGASPSAEGAHQFVNRLEERTSVFTNVYYDGFQLDERTGEWRCQLQCYLTPPAEETAAETESDAAETTEEVTP